jgi:hypothetical protein
MDELREAVAALAFDQGSDDGFRRPTLEIPTGYSSKERR